MQGGGGIRRMSACREEVLELEMAAQSDGNISRTRDN